MKKVSLKTIKDMVKVGAAIDVSSKTSLSIPEPLSKIAYSKTKNAYASSAYLFIGTKSKKLYAVIGMANVMRF